MSTIQKIMTMYWKQITTLMKSGLPVVKCLEAAGKECKDETLSKITLKIIGMLYDGSSLSQALSEFEGYFPTPVIAMVKDGEVKGRLDEAAGNIAKALEDETFKVNELETYVAEFLEETGPDDKSEPVVKAVNLMLLKAFEQRASDIHIEWADDEMVVRFRIDGVLKKVESPAKEYQKAFVTRIKLMAALDIAEKARPQDGRIIIRQDGKDYDLRLSVVPTVTGEAVTIRVLTRETVSIELDEMGLPEDNLQKIKDLANSPYGILLVTGPTGSGKTTTLYGILNYLNDGTRKIVSVENPVEYMFSGVSQIEVRPNKGVTFATALRAVLRQDPDVILAGEIRDRETAAILAQGALTGHLVMSTLHTMDAANALRRLLDVGIEPFLINNTITGVIGQRLVRGLCQKCKEEYEPEEWALDSLGKDYKNVKFYKGKGCEECSHTGYKGRKALNEILVMDKHIRKLVMEGGDPEAIAEAAVNAGMRTFFQDGMELVKKGITTIEEVLRVAPKVS